MATLQERAASVYTPEYIQSLLARNAWGDRAWIPVGGINEAGGTYRHALYKDGTYSPLMQGILSEAEQAELVRQGQGDATSWMQGSAVPLRDLAGGQWAGNTYNQGGKQYTLDMERKASGGANTSLAVLAAIAASMGTLAPYVGGAGAAAGEGAAAGAGGAAGAGAFDAGMGSYLGLGSAADAAAVGSSLGLGDIAAVGAGTAAAGGSGGGSAGGSAAGDAAWGVNPQPSNSGMDFGGEGVGWNQGTTTGATPTVDGGAGSTDWWKTVTDVINGQGQTGGINNSTLRSLLSTLGGGLLGSQSGAKPAGNTTTTTDLPAWMRPYYKNMLDGATGLLNQTTVPNPVLPAAQGEMLKTIRGDYLSPSSNPYLQQTFDMGADRIREKLSPSAGHMQAFGSNTGWNQALGRSLGDFGAQLYGQNYSNERGRQFSATTGAPDFASGSAAGQFAPFTQYSNLFKGSATTSPYFTNPMGNALGGAATGYALSRMFS